MAMPLVLGAVVALGAADVIGWRIAMVIPGVALFLMGIAYFKFTQDYPDSHQAGANGQQEPPGARGRAFLEAARDYRVWALFLIYGACFGVELTMNNIAALYYHDRFGLGVGLAGLIAGLFGLMNLFARSLGGIIGDKVGIRFGLRGRTLFLGATLLVEGIALALFSRMDILPLAIAVMLVFSLFVQMSEGATFSVVPFVNQRALGAVAGIVGAGGNAGAVAAGFLFRMESLSTEMALLYLGAIVTVASSLTLVVRFSPEREREERRAMDRALGVASLAVAPAYAKRVPMALYSES